MKMLNNRERIRELPKACFMQIFGVSKVTFLKMYKELKRAQREIHKKGGRPLKLSVLDKLVIALQYWREYRTYRHIAFDYGVSKSAIGNAVIWVEDTLIKSGLFSLPSQRVLKKEDSGIEVVLVDVTEQPIERPRRGRKNGTPERKSSIQ
jgi:hypothetical protein